MRKVRAKTLQELMKDPMVYEYNFVIHRDGSKAYVTPLMMARLGKEFDLIIDDKDEFGCIWSSWMISEYLCGS